MKVFTSPVLTTDQRRDSLVEVDHFIGLCLKCIQEHVNVPVARHYDIQVSRQQWADDSGVKLSLRRDVRDGWQFRHPVRPRGNFAGTTGGANLFLTQCFGWPSKIFTVYWRLRYWN